MHVCMYVGMHASMLMCVCLQSRMCVCMHVYVYLWMYACIHVHFCTYVCTCFNLSVHNYGVLAFKNLGSWAPLLNIYQWEYSSSSVDHDTSVSGHACRPLVTTATYLCFFTGQVSPTHYASIQNARKLIIMKCFVRATEFLVLLAAKVGEQPHMWSLGVPSDVWWVGNKGLGLTPYYESMLQHTNHQNQVTCPKPIFTIVVIGSNFDNQMSRDNAIHNKGIMACSTHTRIPQLVACYK